MNFIKFFTILILLIINFKFIKSDDTNTTTTAKEENGEEVDELANRLIDNFLNHLINDKKFEPYYHLHNNYSLEIYRQMNLLPIDLCLSKCFITIMNGKLYGLSNIKRSSNGQITNEPITNELIINFIININNILLESNLLFNINQLKFLDKKIISKIGSIYIKMKIVTRKKKHLELLNLKIKRINDVRIRILKDKNSNNNNSTTSFNDTINNDRWLTDFLTDIIITYFNGHVRHVLSRTLFEILKEEFKYF